METDGSSYILFPYPSKDNASSSKFSPYCGITGYRLFPRGMSMQADDIGNRDQMAVLVSKDSLNIFELNKVINAKSSAGFSNAISSALSQYLAPNVRFSGSANGTINIMAETSQPRSAGFCIVEIEKK